MAIPSYHIPEIKRCDCESLDCETDHISHSQHIASKCTFDAKYRVVYYGQAAYLCQECYTRWDFADTNFDSVYILRIDPKLD